MSWGFRCVGGPLDGQMKKQPGGALSFRVAVYPGFRFERFEPTNEPFEHSIKSVQYDLKEHPTYGAAWVCETVNPPMPYPGQRPT